jgi:hypothetical protein
MSRQTIGIGTAANDGTGDPLRTAMGKINDNFAEVYGAAGVFKTVAGLWYLPFSGGSLAAGTAFAANSLRVHPLVVSERCTISDLGTRISTAGTGNVAFAIYARDPATNNPTGAPLGTTSGVSNAAATLVSAPLTTPVTLNPGVYWLAALADSSANYQAAGAGSMFMGWAVGGTQAAISATNTTGLQAYTYAATYGTWPDLTSVAPTAISSSGYALIHYLVSSVP